MATVKYTTSARTKKCRICSDVIVPNTWCVAMKGIQVPNMPRFVDLFFHEGCLSRALDYAKETRSLIVEN